MYELAPLSLMHCSSCGLQATNMFAHRIWGNIWANDGVQPSKRRRLIVFHQLLSLRMNVRRRMLYAELEKSLQLEAAVLSCDTQTGIVVKVQLKRVWVPACRQASQWRLQRLCHAQFIAWRGCSRTAWTIPSAGMS